MNADYTEAKKAIEEVLSRDEFNRGKERQIDMTWLKKILDKIAEFLSKIWEKINEWLEKLLSRMHINFGSGSGAEGAKTAAKIIMIILIVAVIVVVTILLIKVFRRGKIKKMIAAEDKELAEYSHDPDAALTLAEKYRAEGQTRLSFRYLFINLLTELNKREIIRIARYKTNRSYMKEAAASSKTNVADIRPFFDTFNRVWYGGRSIGGAELDGFFEKRTAILDRLDEKAGGKSNG